MAKQVTYADAGVNIAEADRAMQRIKAEVASTHNRNVLAGLGAFGGIYALPAGYRHPVIVHSTDGVGTKLKVAIMAGKHDTVGEDLVNHCVNDIAVQGAKPLTFLDYFATAKLSAEILAEVITGIARGCRNNGVALIGGETAEMPGFYHDEMYDVAGTIIGIAEAANVLSPERVRRGHLLIALPSTGLHTNGYSLARKVLFEVQGLSVDSYVEELGCSVGEELLKIHRSYLKAIQRLLKCSLLTGAAHITGGGITENTPRMLPSRLAAVIETRTWDVPPVFEMLRRVANQPEDDWRQAFNLGVGMIFAVPPARADYAMRELDRAGEEPFFIGEVVKRKPGSPALSYV